MAKKPGKSKGGKRSAKGSAEKAAKGGGGKGDKKSKKGKKGAAVLAPSPVKTGKGAPVGEVAAEFVRLFNASPGNDGAIWDALFHKKFCSIEGGMCWEGRKAVEAKGADFYSKNEVHSASCEGPYVGTTGFGVKFTVDMTCRQTGQRQTMSELAFYRVKNGKVVEEQFFYGCPA